MAKIQSRMEKFKDYREQIKNEEILENEAKKREAEIAKEIHIEKSMPEPEVVNKHTLDESKEQKMKSEKNIYDEYLVKRRIKYFLYLLFVFAIVGTAIALLVIFTNKYLG